MKNIIIARNLLEEIGRDNAMFKRGGIAVHPAATSEDILALHRKIGADLIATDLSLPSMGGAKLCESIRTDHSLKKVSIILACDAAHAPQPSCREVGANAVLERPFDAGVFFGLLSDLLVVPQRKDMRVMLRVSVSGGTGNASFFATSQNISLSGMLIESNYRFAPDDRVTCSFFIGHSEVLVDGVIKRVEKSESGRNRFGVKFLNPATKALIVIEQFVRSRSKTVG